MIKNSKDQIKLEWEIRNKGNWNYKDHTLPSLNTKPITVVHLGDDEFVFKHSDILELIKAYHISDKKSIEMIKENRSGSIKNAELPLLEKIKLFITNIENGRIQTENN